MLGVSEKAQMKFAQHQTGFTLTRPFGGVASAEKTQNIHMRAMPMVKARL